MRDQTPDKVSSSNKETVLLELTEWREYFTPTLFELTDLFPLS